MSTERQERAAVARFSLAMLERLRANSHKNFWRGEPGRFEPLTFETGLDLLRREVEELRDALFLDDRPFDVDLLRSTSFARNVSAVRTEAADVANFAMMIFDLTFEVASDDVEPREPIYAGEDDVDWIDEAEGWVAAYAYTFPDAAEIMRGLLSLLDRPVEVGPEVVFEGDDDPRATRLILSLVDRDVPADVVESWTAEERSEVEKWARAVIRGEDTPAPIFVREFSPPRR